MYVGTVRDDTRVYTCILARIGRARGVAPRTAHLCARTHTMRNARCMHTCMRACMRPSPRCASPGPHTTRAREMTSHGWAPCGVDNERRSAGSLPLSPPPPSFPPRLPFCSGSSGFTTTYYRSAVLSPLSSSFSLPFSLSSFSRLLSKPCATCCFLFGLVTSGETRSSPRLVGGFALARY